MIQEILSTYVLSYLLIVGIFWAVIKFCSIMAERELERKHKAQEGPYRLVEDVSTGRFFYVRRRDTD